MAPISRILGHCLTIGSPLAPSLAFIAGCGTTSREVTTLALIAPECDNISASSADQFDFVALDWDEGISRLYPDAPFASLDLSQFKLTGGGTLADRDEEFKDAVRTQVATILCDFPIPVPRVANSRSVAGDNVGLVQFAHMHSPKGNGQIGEGEYDPCDREHDNVAVIFADELKMFGKSFTFDEWANIFANVTAHEIGHGLGFAHASRPATPDTERSLYVELMYATHTVDEMVRGQRLMADMANCPADAVRGRLSVDQQEGHNVSRP